MTFYGEIIVHSTSRLLYIQRFDEKKRDAGKMNVVALLSQKLLLKNVFFFVKTTILITFAL